MRLIYLTLLFAYFFPTKARSQDLQFITHPRNYNAGLSTRGPVFQLGILSESGYYGEVLIEIHAYSFENDETIINIPTAGGAYMAFYYFTNMASDNPFKFHFGLGYGVYMEESGNNSGYDLTGEISVLDFHLGARHYIIKRIYADLKWGLPIYTNRYRSILTQINSSESKTIIPGLLMLGYRL